MCGLSPGWGRCWAEKPGEWISSIPGPLAARPFLLFGLRSGGQHRHKSGRMPGHCKRLLAPKENGIGTTALPPPFCTYRVRSLAALNWKLRETRWDAGEQRDGQSGAGSCQEDERQDSRKATGPPHSYRSRDRTGRRGRDRAGVDHRSGASAGLPVARHPLLVTVPSSRSLAVQPARENAPAAPMLRDARLKGRGGTVSMTVTLLSARGGRETGQGTGVDLAASLHVGSPAGLAFIFGGRAASGRRPAVLVAGIRGRYPVMRARAAGKSAGNASCRDDDRHPVGPNVIAVAGGQRLPPNPALRSSRTRTPPMPSWDGPKNAPVTKPASPPVWVKVMPRTPIR